jgi:hypothetical protein
MVDVAVATPPPAGVVVEPSKLGVSVASDASIAAYLAAGQRMATVMDLTLKVCVALLALVALAWVFGLLPGAVKLF